MITEALRKLSELNTNNSHSSTKPRQLLEGALGIILSDVVIVIFFFVFFCVQII